jgi:hypothetical protein
MTEGEISSFEIPCSIFDIPSGCMASLLLSNYRPQKNWLLIEKQKAFEPYAHQEMNRHNGSKALGLHRFRIYNAG